MGRIVKFTVERIPVSLALPSAWKRSGIEKPGTVMAERILRARRRRKEAAEHKETKFGGDEGL